MATLTDLIPDGPLHPGLALAAALASLVALSAARRLCGVSALAVVATLVAAGTALGAGLGGGCAIAITMALALDTIDERGPRLALGAGWFAAVIALGFSPIVAAAAGAVLVRQADDRWRHSLVALSAGWLWCVVPDTEAPLLVLIAAVAALLASTRWRDAARAADRPGTALAAATLIGWALAEGTAGRPAARPLAIAGLAAAGAVSALAPLIASAAPGHRRWLSPPVHLR